MRDSELERILVKSASKKGSGEYYCKRCGNILLTRSLFPPCRSDELVPDGRASALPRHLAAAAGLAIGVGLEAGG